MVGDLANHQQLGHRERKKQRTREALVEAAVRLFDEKGYEKTTIAEITAAAGVAPRTFFSYFDTKEDLLFTDSVARLDVGLTTISERRPDDSVVDVLMRIIDVIIRSDRGALDFTSGAGKVRLRLILSPEAIPSVQARAAWWLFEAQTRLSAALAAAFPDELDEPAAAAVVGAFVGAVIAATVASLRRGDPHDVVMTELRRAAQIATQGIGIPVPPITQTV